MNTKRDIDRLTETLECFRDSVMRAIAHGRIGIDAGRFGKWLRSKKGRVVSLQLPHEGVFLPMPLNPDILVATVSRLLASQD